MLTTVRHPNVVLFFGVSFDDSNDDCYILTEFCSQGCLQDVLLDERVALSNVQKLQMALDVATGVSFLHASNLMHRDLKSANVLVATGLALKICDFGISRAIDATEMTGNIGTLPWTAPEMLKGERYDEKIDVYSYGILLWEIVLRQKPYPAMMGPKIIMAVLSGVRPTPPIEGTPHHISGMDTLMESCWGTEPRRRPKFEMIVQTLEDLLSRGSVGARSLADGDPPGAMDAGIDRSAVEKALAAYSSADLPEV